MFFSDKVGKVILCLTPSTLSPPNPFSDKTEIGLPPSHPSQVLSSYFGQISGIVYISEFSTFCSAMECSAVQYRVAQYTVHCSAAQCCAGQCKVQ